MTAGDWKNQLYFGDNLDMLREHIPDESVDLIYLDPPFNSKATYNVLFGEKNGTQSRAQITAFEDTWHWGLESEQAYHEIVTQGPKRLADLTQALRQFLGQNDMMAYLTMMAIRLVELHRVLKKTGGIYLHCDPTASHYLKLVMDAVFGPRQFMNEIIWKRASAHNMKTRSYVRANDTILYFTKSNKYIFNHLFTPYSAAQLSRYKQDEEGRLYKAENLTFSTPNPARQFEWRGAQPPSNRSWGASREKLEEWWREGRILTKKDGTPRLDGLKIFFDETAGGNPLTTLWDDISRIGNTSGERLGYPTQKPEALLERIVKASSNEGDVVLDPFCGCGTAVAVSERLNRRWIGMDITYLAVNLMKRRLADAFGEELAPYRVIGAPKDLASARALAAESRYQFEWWALDMLVDAKYAQDKKKGADTGIDGYINFFDDNSAKAKTIIVQVKSGHVTASQIRDLKGVMEREKATMGAFLTLQAPTRPMSQEAAGAGFYEPKYDPGKRYPRLQILTVEELLAGRELQYPRLRMAIHKKAQRRQKGLEAEQERFL